MRNKERCLGIAPLMKETKPIMRLNPNTRIDVMCPAAPWEGGTYDADRAVDLAYSLSEEYQCDVDLRYNSTGIIFQTVSNY